MGDEEHHPRFEDIGAIFESRLSLDTYRAIYAQVLAAYGHACSLTGERFDASLPLFDIALRPVAIRPRAAGGPLHVGNFIAFSEPAAQAFERGHFVIEADGAVLCDHRVMDPGLAARLPARPRLLLPADPLYRPDPQLLAWHRAHVLSGEGG